MADTLKSRLVVPEVGVVAPSPRGLPPPTPASSNLVMGIGDMKLKSPKAFMKFGSQITLWCSEQMGYVSAGGIVDDRVFLDRLPDRSSMPPNLRDCKFTVVNKLQYGAGKAFHRELTRLHVTRDNWRQTIDEGSRDAHLLRAKERDEMIEATSNETESQRLAGEQVHYGAVVQLQHASSGKYLTIQKMRADVETSGMRVEVMAEGDEGSWFIIHPAFKTHSEGERVMMGDILVLASAKFASSYLHVSSLAVPSRQIHPYVSASYEVNSSADITRFRAIPFCSDDLPGDTLLGDAIIMLTHVESGATLMADNDMVFFENERTTMDSSTKQSSNAIFKIEALQVECAGNPLQWTMHYRFKHFASNRYLCDSPKGLTVTDMYHDQGTMFALLPAKTTSSDTLSTDSLVHLQSWVRQRWVGKGGRCLDSKVSAGHEADTAVLVDDKRDENALCISLVSSAVLSSLLQVRNSLRACAFFLGELSSVPPVEDGDKEVVVKALRSSQLKTVIARHQDMVHNILCRLIRSCTNSTTEDPFIREGPAIEANQALLMEQKGISVVMQILRVLFKDKKLPLWAIEERVLGTKFTELCQLCYRLLKQVVKDNLGYKLALAEHIPFMRSHLGSCLKSAFTLMELYKGNEPLLRNVTKNDIDSLVDIMHVYPEPRFMDFLTAFCRWNHSPFAHNQNQIVSSLLENNQSLIPLVKVEAGVVFLRDASGTVWVDCSALDLSPDGQDADPAASRLFYFWVSCVLLFAELCFGRNRRATDALIRNSDRFCVGYSQLLTVMSENKNPALLRGAVCELLLRLYVDREPQERVPVINRTRIWSRCLEGLEVPHSTVAATEYDEFPTKAPTPRFSDLKAYLFRYLQDLGLMFDVQNTGGNKLTIAMCKAMAMMLEFGFYHHEDGGLVSDANFDEVRQLLDPLLSLLDGRDDLCGGRPVLDHQRFKVDENNMLVMRAKSDILDMVEVFFDMRVNRRITLFLAKWDSLFGAAFSADNNLSPKALQLLEDKSAWESARVWKASDLSDLLTIMFKKPIISERVKAMDSVDTVPVVVEIFIDLMRHDYTPLCAKSFALLNRHLSQRSAFVRVLIETQVLVFPEVIKVFVMAQQALRTLRCQIKWVTSDDEVRRDRAVVSITTVLRLFTTWCTHGSEFECNGSVIFNDTVNTKKFQIMMKNLDVHTYVDDILRLPLLRIKAQRKGETEEAKDPVRRDLFSLCYKFLLVFVSGNTENQVALFPRLTHFLTHMGVRNLNVADTVAACLRDNAGLLHRLDSSFLAVIFNVITQYGRKARWVSLLDTFVVQKGRAVKRIQNMMIKSLMSYGDDVLVLWKTPEQKNKRLELMAASEHIQNESESELAYYVACVRLLALCCEGKNAEAQIRARSLCSLAEAVDSFLDLDFPVALDSTLKLGPKTHVDASTLRFVRGSLLKFLHTVFIENTSDFAITALASAEARLWPTTDDDSDWIDRHSPRCVIVLCIEEAEALLAAEKAMNDNMQANEGKPQTPESEAALHALAEHENFVFDAVCPALTSFFSKHFVTSYATPEQVDLTQRLLTVLQAISDECGDVPRALVELVVVIVEKCGIGEVREPVDDGGDVEAENTEVTNEERLNQVRAAYHTGFQLFIRQYAAELGIEDVTRLLGVGAKNLALLLSRNSEAENSLPPVTYPEMLYRLVLAVRMSEADFTEASLLTILRVLRAMVFLEEPENRAVTNAEHDAAWHRFINNEPVEKSAPSDEVLQWVQEKFNLLGVTQCAIHFITHSSAPVQLAALRLTNTLLENGNNVVQKTIYDHFVETRAEQFFICSRELIRSSVSVMKALRKALKQKMEAESLGTRRMMTRRNTRGATGRASATGRGTGRGSGRGTGRHGETEADSLESLLGQLNNVLELLRLLRWLCEGHYSDMQNYLRMQHSNGRSQDLLAEVVALLEKTQPVLLQNLNEGWPAIKLSEITIQACETLAEASQGPCIDNQIAILSSNFLVVVNRIFASYEYVAAKPPSVSDTERPNEIKCAVKNAVLGLLLSLLEGVENGALPRQMIEALDFLALHHELCQAFKLISANDRTDATVSLRDTFSDDAVEGSLRDEIFSIYFLFRFLSDYDLDVQSGHARCKHPSGCQKGVRVHKSCLRHCFEEDAAMVSFFRAQTRCVEVDNSGLVERVFFRVPEECVKLMASRTWKETNAARLVDVPRENPREKAEEFLEQLKQTNFEIELMSNLHKTPWKSRFLGYQDIILEAPFYLAVAICMLVCLFYGTLDEPWAVSPYGWIVELLVYFGAIGHFVTSILFCALIFMTQGPLWTRAWVAKRKKAKEEKQEEEAENAAAEEKTDDDKAEDPETENTSNIVAEQGHFRLVLPEAPPMPTRDEGLGNWYLLTIPSTYYYILFMAASLGGLAWSPFWFVVHLFDYFRRPDGQLVLDAIYVGGPRLLRTGIMGVLVIFAWGSLSFLVYGNELSEDHAGACQTIFQCVTVHLVEALRSDGDFSEFYGIGKYLGAPQGFWLELFSQGRLVFLLSFFIIWSFLLSNIITGHIIDAFMEIRGEKDKREEDSQTNCFLCSIDRLSFEQMGGGFLRHIDEDHDPMAYLMFIRHVSTKDAIDHNGIEAYVSDCLSNDSIDFLPVSKALVLQARGDDGDEATKLGDVLAAVHSVAKSVEGLDARMSMLETALMERA